MWEILDLPLPLVATLCQWKSQQMCSTPILSIAFVTPLAKCEYTFTCSICWLSRFYLVLEYGRGHWAKYDRRRMHVTKSQK